MGIRTLKEVNRVYGFKIIWRLLTRDSLWAKWLQNNLLKNKCFWEVKEDIQAGSWMWGKIIKYRDMAKQFYLVQVKNGKSTSFWHDK